MNLFKPRYRIVRDHYLGFEVQIWHWWFPLWVQATPPGSLSNTHRSIAEAEAWAKKHADGTLSKKLGVL